ncbi:MAG: hypothetical protein ABFS42_16200 [Candidatus Krumholzibacteriota bacterium]
MKRTILLTFALCLMTSAAFAGGFGLRGGLTLDPDQFHFGGHYNVGQIFEPMRLVPNVEVGFGDNHTFWALNADLIWDIPESAFSIGGELGLNIVHVDVGRDPITGIDYSDTRSDFGLSILGDYRFNAQWFGEMKLGLSDSPDLKLTVGFDL